MVELSWHEALLESERQSSAALRATLDSAELEIAKLNAKFVELEHSTNEVSFLSHDSLSSTVASGLTAAEAEIAALKHEVERSKREKEKVLSWAVLLPLDSVTLPAEVLFADDFDVQLHKKWLASKFQKSSAAGLVTEANVDYAI